jgi:hypothetical protein
VAAIHAAGVVHRDLKPENIVVEPSGRAVIVDFGLAKDPRSHATMNLRAGGAPRDATVTNTGVVVGTPRYMAPEQALGDAVDARADVWALGLIAHELLTGAVPALETGGGRRIAELVKWPAVAPVVRRCLTFAPSERFDDARALLAALVRRKRGGARIAIALVAAIVATLAVIGVRRLVAKDDTAPPVVVAKPDAVKLVQLTNTDDAQWPMAAPMSVALSPDASRFAYTTPVGELRVRPMAGGATATWKLPVIERGSPPKQEALVTIWAVGWYSDGSIGVLGELRDGEWRLYRVHEAGHSELVHTSTQRFRVAIAGEQTVIAADAVFAVLPNDQLQQIAIGGEITALALSPDGKRLAMARGAKDGATIEVMAATGGDAKAISRGPIVEDLLLWLDDDRIAFATVDPQLRKSRMVAYDLRTSAATPRTEWTDAHVSLGSASRGVALLLRGTADFSVQVGDADGFPLRRLHDAKTRGHALAGWTTDARVVFALGEPGKEQLVRASVTQGIEPWPKTSPGVEVPDAVVDNDVIAHELDGDQIMIERIAADGTRTELQRLPKHAMPTVRCAGDRATPCVLEHLEGDQVAWTALDPTTGALGKTYHRRPLRPTRSAALTADGKYLAIVEGTNEVHLITTADDTLRTIATTDADALESIAFAPDNRLWATAVGLDGRLFGISRYVWMDSSQRIVSNGVSNADKKAQLRWFWRATPSPDGANVAMVVRELRLEIARIDGL